MRTIGFLCSLMMCLLTVSVALADKLVLVAGGGTGGDGPALEAALKGPFGVDFDRAGNMYIAEFTGHRLLKVDPRGNLTTVAGTGEKGNGGDGGPGLKARFDSMHSLAVAPDGAVYLADTYNHRIRKFDPKTGTITAFAGSGKRGFSGDGG